MELEVRTTKDGRVTAPIIEHGLPSATLSWLSGYKMEGSRIISPHFRKEDLKDLVSFFDHGDLIDAYGYRAAFMCVVEEAGAHGQEGGCDNKEKEDEQEEDYSKERVVCVVGDKQLTRLRLDDWWHGILPKRVMEKYGKERYKHHPIHSRFALSMENWPEDDEGSGGDDDGEDERDD